MDFQRLRGLIAATYTPMDAAGELRLEFVQPMVTRLLETGVSGLYVCGSTGEGMSLTSEERRQVTEAYVNTTGGRAPVIVQVGHNSIAEARGLARHAQEIGADAISATCPSYFKINDVDTLVDCMTDLAAGAPQLPFYYYHIPSLTGSSIDMVQFLTIAQQRIPNLVGLKYTDTKLYEFQNCLELQDGKFDVVWGCDEMLLGALATGATAAIGSTYNVAAGVYLQMMRAFDNHRLADARNFQAQSIALIDTLNNYPFHSAMKAVLEMLGVSMGRCRLPQTAISGEEIKKLRSELDKIGFFNW